MELLLILALLSGIQAKDFWGPPKVTGRESESKTICCGYDEDFTSNEKYWCRGERFWSCTPVVTSSSPRNGRTSLSDKTRQFCITIKDLTVDDSGPYWCAIDIRGSDRRVPVSITVKPVRPVAPKPEKSTENPTKKPATTSPSVGPMVTSAETTAATGSPVSPKNPTSWRGTLTILGASVGILLLVLCLACAINQACRQRACTDRLENKRDSLKESSLPPSDYCSFAEVPEILYAEVTAGKRRQPQCDIATYDNLYFHTIAEDRSPGGSVEYAAVKR
ncbi:CMRF35-like molecule 5 isoform X2 [Conger conger]|uniref:CMRF35-like molecule 5 isoform X2 n=1 Tax=Conger conger TaxID=82655 RepID=UPI002A59F927|nr:CMRF35-like molecule 5 isoform X2 [Conger conger]